MAMNWDEILREQEESPLVKLIPDGWQDVRIVKADGVTASTGSPMVKLAVEVESGAYAGRQVNTNVVLKLDNPVAMRMGLRRLAAFGITADYLRAEQPTLAQIAGKLLGRSSQAEIITRQWQGEDRNDVNMFKPKDGAAPVASGVGPSGSGPAPGPSGPPPGAEPTANTGPASDGPSGTPEEDPF